MNSKNTISISEARKKIFEIADAVQKPGKFYTFTENGQAKAVLMSAEQFDSLMEDLELLSDPGFTKRMEDVEKEFERGEYSSLEDVRKELGWDNLQPSLVMERANKTYNPRVKIKKKKSK